MAEDLYSIVHSEKYKTDKLYQTMVNESIAEWINHEGDTRFYGYLYGDPFFYDGMRDELALQHVRKNDLSVNHDAIFYVWGWPGPDYTVYKFCDYGITWAFTKEEVKELSIEEWKAYVRENRGDEWECLYGRKTKISDMASANT